MQNVKIVADSSSDLLALDGIAFQSAPLKIITNEKEYVDNKELDIKEMVDDLRHYKGRSSTSCPNPQDWLECFGDAENIFCITITASLSGSYNAAVIAKKQYEEMHPGRRVHVFNSLSTGPEMCLIIEKMKELIEKGLTFDEVVSGTEAYMKKTGLLFILQSMKNLANNGRVSHAAASLAGLLGIRAIGRASDKGDLEMLEKSRGEKKTLESVLEQLKKLGYSGGKLRIAHCFNELFGENIKARILDKYSFADIKIYACRALCSFYAELGGLLIGFEKAEANG